MSNDNNTDTDQDELEQAVNDLIGLPREHDQPGSPDIDSPQLDIDIDRVTESLETIAATENHYLRK